VPEDQDLGQKGEDRQQPGRLGAGLVDRECAGEDHDQGGGHRHRGLRQPLRAGYGGEQDGGEQGAGECLGRRAVQAGAALVAPPLGDAVWSDAVWSDAV
jgi:hypothetical protein